MCYGNRQNKNTVKVLNMKRLIIVVLGLLLTACTHAAGKAPPDLFGLYTSDLAGKSHHYHHQYVAEDDASARITG